MSKQQLSLPYNGTAGYVRTPASRERAVREVRTGVLSERLQRIESLLLLRGRQGMTWVEVAQNLGLHHGQASGALSTMHRLGVVFALRAKHHRCHPYVHHSMRDTFAAHERIDAPSQTKAGQRLALLEDLHDACQLAQTVGWTKQVQTLVTLLLDKVAEHDGRAQG